MGRDRYVVLGLARSRAAWFGDLARWATSGSLPLDYHKCVSVEEIRSRLRASRPFSAAVLDAGVPAVDRDLLAELRDAGVVPVIVSDGRDGRDWRALGALATLPPTFGREVFLDTLATFATVVGDGVVEPVTTDEPLVVPTELGRLVAVTGPGGTGASTAAIALAQGLAADHAGGADGVLLADLCRHAEQAALHDARDVVPGVQELVDLHRGRTPEVDAVRALTFAVQRRGYHLLLGLRRARYWTTIRPATFDVALTSLRRAYGVVVCDLDADLEGEPENGSPDVEDRHAMARAVAARADVVLAVGAPGLKGVFSLVRVLDELLGFGVPAARIVPVVNRAPRHPRQRAELASATAQLLRTSGAADELASPVFLPRRKVDEALRDGAALPEPLPRLLVGAYAATLERRTPDDEPLVLAPVPERIAPGSLGRFADDLEDDLLDGPGDRHGGTSPGGEPWTQRPDGGFFGPEGTDDEEDLP